MPDCPVECTQSTWELQKALVFYKAIKPRRVLEVGTHYGGTLWHWLRNAPSDCVVCSIDDHHINDHLYDDWTPSDVSLMYYRGKSQDRGAVQWANEHGLYDWIFIDAGHSYEEVSADWDNFAPLTSRYGIVVFHDITPHPNRGVDRLWNELKERFPHIELIEPGSDLGIGMIFK